MIYIRVSLSKKQRNVLEFSPLVLASTSVYRRELLERLQIPFQTAAPDVDETRCPVKLPNKPPGGFHARKRRRWRLIIRMRWSSDRIRSHCWTGSRSASAHPRERGAPATRHARQHGYFLYRADLLDAGTGEMQTEVAENRVSFRELSDDEIETYLRKEQPTTAQAAQNRKAGIALISRMEGMIPML